MTTAVPRSSKSSSSALQSVNISHSPSEEHVHLTAGAPVYERVYTSTVSLTMNDE